VEARSDQSPVLGKYRPILKLGQGGMADVYLAISRSTPGLERLAVIKRLRSDLLVTDDDNPNDAEQFIRMFWDEAKLGMLLKHANVVHTYDAADEGGTLYLVMEYIEGQSLSVLQRELTRKRRQLPPVQAAVIISDVLAGLHYAHEVSDVQGQKLNIVHRDVSPQNMLIGYDGSIKLLDFGVAKTAMRTGETRAGMMKGKARYMAPEQVLNGDVDRRADIYAAGVVLWELVAGRKMVSGTNVLEQLVSVMKTPAPKLSTFVPDVDPELESVVHKALEREPENRYATALEMREALQTYIASKGGPRAEDVAVLVRELFTRQREETQKIIRERLATLAAEVNQTGESKPVTAEVFAQLDTENRGLRLTDHPGSLNSGPSGGSISLARGASSVSSLSSLSRSGGSFTPGAVVQSPTSASPPTKQASSRKLVPVLLASLAVLLVTVGTLLGVVVSGSKTKEVNAATSGETKTSVAASPPPKVDDLSKTAPRPTAETKSTETKAETKDTAAATAPAKPAAPVAQPQSGWRPTPASAPSPKSDPAPKDEPTNNAEAPGYFTIDTYPWTNVSIDGRAVGQTPIVKVPVSPGTHTVVLENPTDNIRQATTINVKSGESISKRLAF
jgi:serine/threonine-protein kinase